MSDGLNAGSEPQTEARGRARALAVRVLERWRGTGFDGVLCYPSGYCCPVNSSAARLQTREGYRLLTLGSQDALDALAASIEAGCVYRA